MKQIVSLVVTIALIANVEGADWVDHQFAGCKTSYERDPHSAAKSTDWIGCYEQGDTPGVDTALAWEYVDPNNIAQGSLTGVCEFGSSIVDFYYFEDDGYTILDSDLSQNACGFGQG